MSDFKDMMGIERTSKGPKKLEDIISPKNKKKSTPKPKDGVKGQKDKTGARGARRGGISLGDVPPLAPTPNPDNALIGLKEKRKLETTGSTPWVWKPFRNAARKDGLVLFHWAKDEEETDEYSFARFNKRITMFEYTNEQYNRYFNKDPNWTKEETDELWKLCKDFDLRFTVVHDRFSGNKTMEDLKERYYSISRKLLELSSPDEDISKHPLIKFTYNKEHELERKRQYEKLYSRTPEQVEEEKRLIQEFKRIEANLKKHQKDNNKKKTPVVERVGTTKRLTKKKKDEDMISNEDDDGASLDEAFLQESAAKASRKEKATGVFSRSSLILTPLPVSNKTGKKVDDILIELGIGLRPMPTAAVCKVFNEIRHDIVSLLSLQRQVASKEYQVQMLRDRRQRGEMIDASPQDVLLSPALDPYSTDFIDAPVRMKKRTSTVTKDKKLKKKKHAEDMDY